MSKKTEQIIEPIKASFDNVANKLINEAANQVVNKKIQAKDSGTLEVQGVEIHLVERGDEDYISLTDMTQNFDGGGQLIKNWLQNKNTIDFLGVWEKLNSTTFNLVEFHQVKEQAGSSRFVMSAKLWIEKTNGIGLLAKSGRYGGGTFAHKDIALEFASWLSPEFKLYLIKEFQRLKQSETVSEGQLQWNIRRTLVKAQYRAHTDAIKTYLIPKQVTKIQEGYIYANEADLLNAAVFGMTAKEWKSVNPGIEGTQRDSATIEQLVILAGLESQNALLIEQGKTAAERLKTLNEQARKQMQALLASPAMKKLSDKPLLN